LPAINPALTRVRASSTDRCEGTTADPTPARYRPRLRQAPVTQAAPYNPDKPPASASATLRLSFDDPLQFPIPKISLLLDPKEPDVWQPPKSRDLIGSGPNDKHFVVEVETDGTAYL